MRACLLPLVLIVGGALFGAVEPCLQPGEPCSEPVPMNTGFVTVYRNFPVFAEANPQVDRALIMIHGAQRNGDGYYATAMAAAAATGNLSHTIIIAPVFRGRDGNGCNDPVKSGELYWSCQGWNAGFDALDPKGESHPALTSTLGARGFPNSFDVIDRILTTLGDKSRFPRLQSIVVAGHSGGGQFVQRYAAMNSIAESIGIPVRYVVGNPSSYVYLDAKRPATNAGCTPDGKCTSAQPFGPYGDRVNCTGYDNYRYGLEALQGYAVHTDPGTIRKMFVARNVTYLIGDLDVLQDSDLDKSCPAYAQGMNRRERGVNYWNYMRAAYKAEHKLVIVPRCGHNAACMFTAATGARVLFP